MQCYAPQQSKKGARHVKSKERGGKKRGMGGSTVRINTPSGRSCQGNGTNETTIEGGSFERAAGRVLGNRTRDWETGRGLHSEVVEMKEEVNC